ncbi:MAG: hypothetical protein IPG10_06760 [Flavobacteriales bacterium]|nr:hypothetical protein [Flavobacteriales bacterium]MBK7268536.1 hypothetical protein [Flavobacteriales bacterium]MBK7753050.1 hypothetical protein [Flavobacteriales bacterium]MBK9076078.1 hypothetical protein [Flavobacteriales bacterium]MBK9537149.1 hypothetical protein [Flavobacteriales bacterium]
MLDRIYDLYDELERRRVMLSFKGDLSEELVSALLGLVERKMSVLEPDARMRKRVFNVAMECLQNLYHHNTRLRLADVEGTATNIAHGVVMIMHHDKGYSVLTGNFVADKDVHLLKDHLDRINAMAPDELRGFYQQTLANGRYTNSGGGGLGIIDIARKSGQKLEYGFVPFDTESAFFSLNVNVTN